MRTVSWRKLVLAFVVVLSCLSFTAFAQSDQDTQVTPTSTDESAAKVKDADRDDPNSRLQWERGTWGIANPEFRANAIREGKKHSDKKNEFGSKCVSIGPTGADYEQNGSFTGHVRDSGRARTILPHPSNPDIVYFLTSGGGLWRTNNWQSANTTWTVLTDDLPTTGGGAVAFGRNPNDLYLGLGDPYDQILVGGSIVKSKNGGNSWDTMIELGTAVSVRDVKVDTSTNR